MRSVERADVERAHEHVKGLEIVAAGKDGHGHLWHDWALREMYYRGLEEAHAAARANGKKAKVTV